MINYLKTKKYKMDILLSVLFLQLVIIAIILLKYYFRKRFNVPIYCINLESSVERRKRMTFRLNNVINANNYTFIKALKPCDLVNKIHIGDTERWYSRFKTPEECDMLWKKDICCYHSHIKAIKSFYYDNVGKIDREDWGIIVEDDVLFHNDFVKRFEEMKSKIPNDVNLVTLGFMVDMSIFSREREFHEGFGSFIDVTWGAQCYMIRLKYALELLDIYDAPLDMIELNVDGKVTSEVIIRRSEGLVCVPPLVIEDCIDSDRSPDDNPYHIKHFGYWEWSNYSDSDPRILSPLANISKEECWKYYKEVFEF